MRVPVPPLPKRKFPPTTTISAPSGGEAIMSTKRSARIRENARVNGRISSSSTSSEAISSALRSTGVSDRRLELGAQHGDRVGLEGDHHDRDPALAAERARLGDDLAMSEVDPVEGPDCDGAAPVTDGQLSEGGVGLHG